ncbi:MAG: FHA domain-containing protein [Myxococcaceae bacterium]
MPARNATSYLNTFLRDRQRFTQELDVPVLVWEAGPEGPDGKRIGVGITQSGYGSVSRAPAPGETLVFELRKVAGTNNPFAMGVTVGRIDQNDIGIEDGSVSRFHAYFQQTPVGWVICDAESKNGTFVNGRLLVASQKTPVPDGAKVKFGEVEMRFMLPKSFADWLRTSWSKA